MFTVSSDEDERKRFAQCKWTWLKVWLANSSNTLFLGWLPWQQQTFVNSGCLFTRKWRIVTSSSDGRIYNLWSISHINPLSVVSQRGAFTLKQRSTPRSRLIKWLQYPIEFFRMEFYKIYRIYRICRKLFLVVLKMKITKNSLLQFS